MLQLQTLLQVVTVSLLLLILWRLSASSSPATSGAVTISRTARSRLSASDPSQNTPHRACPSLGTNGQNAATSIANATLSRLHATAHLKRPHRHTCPCCGWTGPRFRSVKGKKVPRVCPGCGSMERHRRGCALALAGGVNGAMHDTNCASPMLVPPQASQEAGIPFRLVHFGPHRKMEALLAHSGNVDQVSLDFFAPGYTQLYDANHVLQGDVTNIQLPNAFADGIVILHVLEHISTLDRALHELRRVLKPTTGWVLAEVPCRHGDGHGTRHCWNKTERVACGGQWDHVWRFDCKDFLDRLKEAGFQKCRLEGRKPFGLGTYGDGEATLVESWYLRGLHDWPAVMCLG